MVSVTYSKDRPCCAAMRFKQTAIGWKVESNAGRTLTISTLCRIERNVQNKYLVVKILTDNAVDELTRMDNEIRSKLRLVDGAWDHANQSLMVKCMRGCKITFDGQGVGSWADMWPGQQANATLRLAGAWTGGYSWAACEFIILPSS